MASSCLFRRDVVMKINKEKLIERLEKIKEEIEPNMTFTEAWNCSKLVVDLIHDITKEELL